MGAMPVSGCYRGVVDMIGAPQKESLDNLCRNIAGNISKPILGFSNIYNVPIYGKISAKSLILRKGKYGVSENTGVIPGLECTNSSNLRRK